MVIFLILWIKKIEAHKEISVYFKTNITNNTYICIRLKERYRYNMYKIDI